MQHKKIDINLEDELSYRFPLLVKEKFILQNKYVYPVCPRYKTTLEREYQCFCDRCGQALDWTYY